MVKLSHDDYRPIRKGDIGWTEEKQKARWYYSPSSHNSITLRQFQKFARGGVTYEKYVRKREAAGIARKKYAPRKPKIVVVETPRKPLSHQQKRRQKQGTARTKYIQRALELKDSFARKRSQQLGYGIVWEDLTDKDKTKFWQVYHELVDHLPSENDYTDYYDDFFDYSYEDIGDLEYGETP